MMIPHSIHFNYDRRGKQAHLIPGVMQIQAHCVESAGSIRPVGWSDYAFLAESKDLPAGNEVRPALRGTPDLHIRLANIPRILVRDCAGNGGIEESM